MRGDGLRFVLLIREMEFLRNIKKRIFDPFFTTKEVGKGTGQGLAIAHNVIVDKHGGTISFDTKAGQGTTFIIRLPIEGDVTEG